MPTYEYVCHDCNNRFEKWQKMSEAPLTTCPTCGGPIRRVFYPAGIVFKGSGFYKTDHPGGANGHAHGEEKTESKAEAATASSKTAETSSESKATASSSASSASSAGSASSGSSSSTAESKAS